MPPALRSAPSTPRAFARTSTPAAADSESASVALTPRKSPHCKTCGRPRKGHPLRACEADSPLKSTTDSPLKSTTASPLKSTTVRVITPQSPPARSNNLIDALEAMNLDDRDRKEKRERRKSAQALKPGPFPSLPSLSTFTGELLDSLPGLLADDGSDHEGEDSEKREAVSRWRETSGVPAATAPLVESPINNAPALADDLTPTKKRVRATVGK
ncbi:hypothetical protein K438DRAFT_1750259 [Mycena galopus ATCC 62051]|nr:hypothetical protein K438DRAFT_1750259 [Mycena galopus ATCC 62051]